MQGCGFVNLPSLLYHPYLVCTLFGMPSLHPFTFLIFLILVQFSTGHLSPLPIAMVNITEDPRATGPVLVGERAVFTCRARSIPPPTITWFQFQNGMEVVLVDNGDDITITSQSQPEDNFTTLSVLSVRVTGDEDFTRYFCVGDNGFDNSTSDVAQLGCMITQ